MSELQDTHGRRFSYLRLSITDVCNFRCQYCLPNGYKKNADRSFLSAEEIVNLTTGLAGLGMWKVRLTGGEPTVRKDFAEIAARVSSVPGIRKVAATTNGYVLADNAMLWRQAGISAINVSIDSLDRRTFHAITGHDYLPRVLAGVEQAKAAGFASIKINTVLLKGCNDGEIDSFLGWIKNQPVSLRFIELMQTGDNLEYFKKHHLSGAETEKQLTKRGWQKIRREEGEGPAQEFSHPDYQGRVGIIAPYSKDFCQTCNRLRVTARGDLRLCLFGSGGHSLRHLLQSPDRRPELQQTIIRLLSHKAPKHLLHFGQTGATPQLASLGG